MLQRITAACPFSHFHATVNTKHKFLHVFVLPHAVWLLLCCR